MANWISLDWDWVTADCRKVNRPRKCTSVNCKCDNANVIGRGLPEMGRTDWRIRLDALTDFLDCTKISECFVHDSHGDIFRYLNRGDCVLNYDEHTDDYNDEGPLESVACWNWVNHAKNNDIIVYQCQSVSDLLKIDRSVEYKLFVAWSTPYTRPDLDGHLFRFLMNLNVPVVLNLNFVE